MGKKISSTGAGELAKYKDRSMQMFLTLEPEYRVVFKYHVIPEEPPGADRLGDSF